MSVLTTLGLLCLATVDAGGGLPGSQRGRFSVSSGGGLPVVTGTQGSIWPKPQMDLSQETFLLLNSSKVKFTIGDLGCPMLDRVLARYLEIIKKIAKIQAKESEKQLDMVKMRGTVAEVNIWLMGKCEDLPHEHMDEHYEIKVDSPDRPGEVKLIAPSIWGMMRAVESFTHLLVPTQPGLLRVNSTQVQDYPRFPHRGFMIDTSRHFLPLRTIEEMIDLLNMNKFNVLHWHIVDDPSFPYQSIAFPQLSGMGAYSPAHVYSQEDVRHLIQYAADRGVRVLPEFDTPGHTASWGLGQPGLLTQCYGTNGQPNGRFGPVDPTAAANYDFMLRLLSEVSATFNDSYLHLGGDEVDFSCWKSNPEISKFMLDNNITTYPMLEQFYISKVLSFTDKLTKPTTPVVWQEVFDNGLKLSNNTIVHVWKWGDSLASKYELFKVTAAGYQTLLSSCWYLNYIHYGRDWTDRKSVV